jgi:2-iminobutanoate/2-iminopropanoate deaminase
MPKQPIRTDSAGPPLGAYSQGIRAGDFVFVSGCGPIDPGTGGASLADVVKATVHLLDETEFPSFNEVYARRMPEPRPVRTTVGSGLRQVPGMLVEIDVIAYVGD